VERVKSVSRNTCLGQQAYRTLAMDLRSLKSAREHAMATVLPTFSKFSTYQKVRMPSSLRRQRSKIPTRSTKYREAPMVNQCANPNCSKLLVYLREGRIFTFDMPDPRGLVSSSRIAHRKEHYWLCGDCSQTLVLVHTCPTGVVVCPDPLRYQLCWALRPVEAFRAFTEGGSDESSRV
jgi:hypothetical protein